MVLTPPWWREILSALGAQSVKNPSFDAIARLTVGHRLNVVHGEDLANRLSFPVTSPAQKTRDGDSD